MKRGGESIAIYSRKSRFTGKGESIGNQVELCRGYISSHFGEEAAESCVVFEDEGFSGGDLKRPAFQKMLEGVRSGGFRAMVVYRLDRISRNISDFAGLVEELGKRGVAFFSIREQFDTGSPMGRAMMYIISVFSQLERETIGERIRDNMHQLAKTGRWLGGNTPTGYTSESISSITVDGKRKKLCRLKLLPEEAKTVQTIFELYLRLGSLTAVETELLRRGLKTKRGNPFTRFSLKGILENPVYMVADDRARAYFAHRGVEVYAPPEAFDGKRGIMAYNRTDQEKGCAAVYLPMEEWIVSVGEHPGLIPSQQWIQAQEVLGRNKSGAYRQPRKNEALLTGLLYCACGSRMYPKLTGRTREDGTPLHSYVCREKVRSRKTACHCPNAGGAALDEALWRVFLGQQVHRKTFLAHLEKKRSLFRENTPKQADQYGEELSRNEKKINSLLDAMSLTEDPETKSRITRRMEELLEANGHLRSRMELLEQQTKAETLDPQTFETLRLDLSNLERCMAQLPWDARRHALQETVERILWDGNTATVVWKMPG